MNARNARVVILVALAPLPTVSASWGLWVGDGSFSPVAGTGDNGKPLKPKWTYAVNRNKPLHVNQSVEGVSVNHLKFSDLTVSIDPATLLRTTRVSASILGSGGGTASIRVTDSLQRSDDGKIRIPAETATLSMGLFVQGIDVKRSSHIMAQFTPAIEWFIVRNDLDTPGPGHVSADPPTSGTGGGGLSFASGD